MSVNPAGYSDTFFIHSFIHLFTYSLIFSFIIQKIFLEHPLYFTPQCKHRTFIREQTEKKISALMVLTLSGGRETESKIVTKMYGTFHLISVVERLKAEKEVWHFLWVTKETGISDGHLKPCSTESACELSARTGKINLWPPRCSQPRETKPPHHIISIHRKTAPRKPQAGCWEPASICGAAYEGTEHLGQNKGVRLNEHWNCPQQQFYISTRSAQKQLLHIGNICPLDVQCLEGKDYVLFTQATAPQEKAKHHAGAEEALDELWPCKQAEGQLVVWAHLRPNPLRSLN